MIFEKNKSYVKLKKLPDFKIYSTKDLIFSKDLKGLLIQLFNSIIRNKERIFFKTFY